MGRGEEEPAPDAAVLIGDEVLKKEGNKRQKHSDRKLAFQIKSLILCWVWLKLRVSPAKPKSPVKAGPFLLGT